MAKKLTSAAVRRLWAHMCRKYPTRLLHKRNSYLVRLLKVMDIDDLEKFLKERAISFTDFGPGKEIVYLPFQPGTPTSRWPLFAQVALCAHEFDHVLGIKKDKTLGWKWMYKYATSTAFRTHVEISGYTSNMELRWWYDRKTYDIAKLAAILLEYGCSKKDVKVAEKALSQRLDVIKRGAIVNRSSMDVIAYLSR